MQVSEKILEGLFVRFTEFLKAKGEQFTSFSNSKHLNEKEGYKEAVFYQGHNALGFPRWSIESIGSGVIQNAVNNSIQTRVYHNYKMEDNNLINWRKKDDFKNVKPNKDLELALFNFYKSKVKDGVAFENLLSAGLSYQFIAYLFFLKNKNLYLPISQEKFDDIFEKLGLHDFKTRNNASWENYQGFIGIIKDVLVFLKSKDAAATLLDAHSFLWVINDLDQEVPIKKKPIEKAQANTFLFAWNPEKWKWKDLEANIEELNMKGSVTQMWSCASHKKIKVGDRAFLIRLGSEPRGICGSGTVVSQPFLSKHWDDESKENYRVLIQFDVLLNPEEDKLLLVEDLHKNGLADQVWTPMASGIAIKPEVIYALEKLWFDLQSKNGIILKDPVNDQVYMEGSVTQVLQNRYERNPHAREECLEHYGYSCVVCDFDFEKTYGDIGQKYIHVHHLNLVSNMGGVYKVNPINDLRPVCPNCHAMLHKQNPPIKIEELRSRLKMN